MALTRMQKVDLNEAPLAEAIKTRDENGRTFAYLEGWYVIREANRIFGVDHWDRITLTAQCVWQGKYQGQPACTYTARVRICIRAGAHSFVREGSGVGHGQGHHPGEAHGQALKAAETDATKRALATLGAPFGLTLYEHEPKTIDKAEERQNPSTPKETLKAGLNGSKRRAQYWALRGPDGETKACYSNPLLSCSALRRMIEGTTDAGTLEAIYMQNRRLLARLVAERPDLKSDTDRHYAEILSALFQTRLKTLAQSQIKPEPKPEYAANGAEVQTANQQPALPVRMHDASWGEAVTS